MLKKHGNSQKDEIFFFNFSLDIFQSDEYFPNIISASWSPALVKHSASFLNDSARTLLYILVVNIALTGFYKN